MKKYGIIGIVFVGVAVICAFTFRGHKEADYLLTDFPAEADPVTVGNKIADRFLTTTMLKRPSNLYSPFSSFQGDKKDRQPIGLKTLPE